ncbi:MAG TPA: response regulator [Syntrophorhabdaceae bacterium]|nr:response regulator [Syntrophorhabdaceae bacterium]HQM80086.1 response regulator [Syntrophorhabdaceae bacterium]
MSDTVLLIEDNEQNIYLIRFLLEKNGFKVEEARNGQEGIDKAVSIKPDLVLLDIQLPDIDGYAVAKRLRGHKEFEDIPIIAVTSYAMTGDKEKCINAGCTGYIEKPINPDSFVREISKYLRKKVN